MKTKHKYEVIYTTKTTAMLDNGDGTATVVPATKNMSKSYLKKVDAYADIRRLLSECGESFLKAELNPIGKVCPEVYDATNWQDAKITRS